MLAAQPTEELDTAPVVVDDDEVAVGVRDFTSGARATVVIVPSASIRRIACASLSATKIRPASSAIAKWGRDSSASTAGPRSNPDCQPPSPFSVMWAVPASSTGSA
ncbi:MAG: hypothetical protein AAF721_21700 [Myxococcota bacterium]